MLNGSLRRGFTLIELMLSVVLLSAVSLTLYRLLTSSQKLALAQSDRISLQSTVRGAALVIGAELREMSAVPGGTGAENDILSLSAHAISYRAMRGFGFICQTLPAGDIRIARSVFTGFRDPQPGRDSVLILAPGVLSPSDSGWSALPVSSVSTSGSCFGSPAITLATGAAASIPAGTPVRIFEPMQLASYQSEGKTWLGMRSLATGESIQPLFGPIAEGNGFELQFTDVNGVATVASSAVRSITVSIRGLRPNLSDAPEAEDLTLQLTLRNGSG